MLPIERTTNRTINTTTQIPRKTRYQVMLEFPEPTKKQ